MASVVGSNRGANEAYITKEVHAGSDIKVSLYTVQHSSWGH